MKFEHDFKEDDINTGVLFKENFSTKDEKISFSYSIDDGIWLNANREGMLKLAKILIELALRSNRSTHSHYPSDFKLNSNKSPEVTVALDLNE